MKTNLQPFILTAALLIHCQNDDAYLPNCYAAAVKVAADDSPINRAELEAAIDDLQTSSHADSDHRSRILATATLGSAFGLAALGWRDLAASDPPGDLLRRSTEFLSATLLLCRSAQADADWSVAWSGLRRLDQSPPTTLTSTMAVCEGAKAAIHMLDSNIRHSRQEKRFGAEYLTAVKSIEALVASAEQETGFVPPN